MDAPLVTTQPYIVVIRSKVIAWMPDPLSVGRETGKMKIAGELAITQKIPRAI
jgi:hypothetical protein